MSNTREEDKIVKGMSNVMLTLGRDFAGEDISMMVEAVSKVLMAILDERIDYTKAESGDEVLISIGSRLKLSVTVENNEVTK